MGQPDSGTPPEPPEGTIYRVVFRDRARGPDLEVHFWSARPLIEDARADGLQQLMGSGRNPEDFEDPQVTAPRA